MLHALYFVFYLIHSIDIYTSVVQLLLLLSLSVEVVVVVVHCSSSSSSNSRRLFKLRIKRLGRTFRMEKDTL